MRMRTLTAFFVLMYLCGASFAETVIYDGNNIYPFEGRTREDVSAKYKEARNSEGTHRNRDYSTWYEVSASLKFPYNAGKLTQDTHNAMSAMTNFYRWLAGVKVMPETSAHSDSLQAQALIRNFSFAHIVDDSKKPADMEQSLWDLGVMSEEEQHEVLYTGPYPPEAISGWLQEGYNTAKGTWDTIGHRMEILSGYISSVNFAVSGSVAAGSVRNKTELFRWNTGNFFEGAFSAFPSPGPMPRRKIDPKYSSWHAELNDNIIYIPDRDNITVTVTELSTGKSYTCTNANGGLGSCTQYEKSTLINFRQPSECSDDGYYSGSYRIDITGLKELSSGQEASITYTVDFTEIHPEIVSSTILNASLSKGLECAGITIEGSASECTLSEGNLPDGIELRNYGGSWQFYGKPSSAGEYNFVLNVSNEYGESYRSFTITAGNYEPSITTESFDIAVKGTEYSATLTAKSDSAVTWTYKGRLPAGLTLDSSGKISGTPTKAGKFTFTVTATNDYGKSTKRFTIQVFDPVTITTKSLKDAKINKSYSVTIRAKGTKPFTWSAENLPNGLSINAKTGRISGKPTSAGNFTVKVSAENSAGTVTQNFSLNVKGIAPKISGTLAKATLNEQYSSSLKVTGTEPITYTISGTLPEGLTFDTSTGKISGVPTSYAKSGYKITITAKNDAGEKSKKVTLMVKGTAPKITTAKLTEATVNQSYSFTLTATGSEPITFSADNLPDGLTLSRGVISGKPTKAADAHKIVIYAENPVKKVKKTLTLKINADESDTRLPIIRFSNGTYYTALTGEFLPENISGGYVFPLGEVSCDEPGMYDFELEFPDYVREGSELVYIANSESPSDDDNIAEFFDENGNEIAAVPESRKIIISIWLNEGITYKPVIIAIP